MMFEAKGREITLNQIRAREVAAETVEGDVIVPDVQGDIGKVLQVKASCAVESKEVNGERITLSGTVHAFVLYLPLGGGGMESMHMTLPFEHFIRVDGGQLFVDADAEVTEISYYLYHSRKMNVKATVTIRYQISADECYQVVTGAEADCPAELKYLTVPCIEEHIQSDQVLAIREQLELTGSLPDISRILFWEGKLREPEVQLMTNKAMIKGELVLSFFYYSIDETAEQAEQVIPFTEVVDAVGVYDGMESDCSLRLADLQLRAEEDGDGDIRTVAFSGKILVHIQAAEVEQTEVVEDLFCTDFPVRCQSGKLRYSGQAASVSREAVLRDSVRCEGQPPIGRVLSMEGVASVSNTIQQDGKTTAEGSWKGALLYISPEGEYCSLAKEIPFSLALEGSYQRGDLEAKAGSFSYHLISAEEVELRGSIYIEGTGTQTTEIACVSDAAGEDCANGDCPRPSLVIYFIQPEDTLWNVAKRYGVTQNSIITANQIGEGALKPGQKLLIPR